VTLSDGSIRNGYTVKILNKKQEQRTFRLSLEGLPGATMEMVGETCRHPAAPSRSLSSLTSSAP
jgi:polyferredoxin